MNGRIAEIRNHRRNDEPLRRPTIPPARPKNRAMIRYATSELAEGPDDAEDREHHHDDGGEPREEPDDDLQQHPRRHDEDDEGDEACDEARSCFLFHASIVDALEVREPRFAARAGFAALELEPRQPVA